ncbi:hypothetical protein M5K25_013547 [Dendrobium thyrsiflorum]|uniref:Uncharacterized protein n=1 Tax=Dendrobium thyrsiflorum TaxID=117978 RepID=A0ABD0UTN5_DENTH
MALTKEEEEKQEPITDFESFECRDSRLKAGRPEALDEGSNHNLDYQMISKHNKLKVESSGSTRRIQRTQEHRILTSLTQGTKREIGDRSSLLAPPRPPPEFYRTTVGPPPDTEVLPDHHLRHVVLLDHHIRPDVLLDHHLRPDILPDHHLRPDILPDCHLRPDILPDHHLRPDVLLDYHLRPDVLSNYLLTAEPPPEARRSARPPLEARRSAESPPEARHSAGPPPEARRPPRLQPEAQHSTGPPLEARSYAVPPLEARSSTRPPPGTEVPPDHRVTPDILGILVAALSICPNDKKKNHSRILSAVWPFPVRSANEEAAGERVRRSLESLFTGWRIPSLHTSRLHFLFPPFP